jgi:predicted nucleotidyltransferase
MRAYVSKYCYKLKRQKSKGFNLFFKHRQYLPKLKQEYNISYLGIFGSYIHGEQIEDSDLDILVEFSKEPDLLEFIGLKQELSEILGVEVNLDMKTALKPRIGKKILEEVMQIN